MKLKLLQGQIWKKAEDEYLRIVGLERLEVKYKSMNTLQEREGTHHHVTKKEFCKLIKTATLLTPEEIKAQQTLRLPAIVLKPAAVEKPTE
ncbi:MAG: hypothetical protein JWM68_1380 [Verrucomicrobiales bacterium]|nr:hypothetical protein [Verrucomicrobiales bacterium]